MNNSAKFAYTYVFVYVFTYLFMFCLHAYLLNYSNMCVYLYIYLLTNLLGFFCVVYLPTYICICLSTYSHTCFSPVRLRTYLFVYSHTWLFTIVLVYFHCNIRLLICFDYLLTYYWRTYLSVCLSILLFCLFTYLLAYFNHTCLLYT